MVWCKKCNREFKSHWSLIMHYMKSIEHAKGPRRQRMLAARVKKGRVRKGLGNLGKHPKPDNTIQTRLE